MDRDVIRRHRRSHPEPIGGEKGDQIRYSVSLGTNQCNGNFSSRYATTVGEGDGIAVSTCLNLSMWRSLMSSASKPELGEGS
jgi:hypothetical protein